MTIALDTDFPGGNGLLLSLDESADRPLVRFAAEPKNCPQALWFHFCVKGLDGRGVRVVLANPAQTLGGADWSGDSIVVRAGGQTWRRLGRPAPVRTAGGRVEWAWDVDAAGKGVEVAFCYPYQPADLAATLAELGDVFRTEFIGVTLAGRPMPRVFNRLPNEKVPGVLLTARHHAGEVPGAWVLDGLLRHVAAERRLRERITWWAVPFVDLDDVVAGSYGKDPFPHDCNRAYGPSAPRRPEGGAVIREVLRLREGCSAMFFVDLHAPGHGERASYIPVRGWEKDSPINPIAYGFAESLQAAVPEELRSPTAFIVPRPGGNSRYAGYSSSRWVASIGVDAVTLETSYQGNETTDYTLDDYRRIGAALAETIAHRMLS